MSKDLLDHRQFERRRRGEKARPLGASAVEEIWSSWRYEKAGAQSKDSLAAAVLPSKPRAIQQNATTSAEFVNQLKRQGEYQRALEVALFEIEREEKESAGCLCDRKSVPWYYWEAATILRRLKRYSEEIALIKRFANNHDIHFRAFSKRYRSSRVATYAWATNFLERIEAARAAAVSEEASK